MKAKFTFLFLFFYANVFSQKEAIHEKSTEVKPNEVTVFMTGAELSHTSSIQFSKGKNLIVFKNLSSKIDPSSIVVDIENKGVMILSVYNTNNFLKQPESSPAIKSIKDSIERVQDQLHLVKGKMETLQKEKQLLFVKETIAPSKDDIKKIQDYGDYCRNRENGINEELLKLGKKEKWLQNKQQQYQSQLHELNASIGLHTNEISVLVLASDQLQSNAILKYRVADAGWAPKYDIRVDGIGKPVNLYYRANIYNNTGIDWNNVKLKLSTADPMQGAQFPTMEEWNLYENQEQSSSYKRSQMQNNKLQADNKEIQFQILTVDELSAEFTIDLPYTIPADNRPYLVDVNHKELAAKYEYISVPKMDKDAFLVAKVVGWAELSLVSGKANVYYNGSYIGQSSINITEISDTLTLSLGRDNKIAITRMKKSEMNDHQFIGNYEKETYNYDITLRNNRDTKIILYLKDQVPVQNDSRISVGVTELNGGTYNKHTGEVEWVIALEPGESKKINFNFWVKYPKSFSENGKPKKRSYRSISAPSF